MPIKKGVGKNHEAINLNRVAAIGERAVVDLDPQGNASTGLELTAPTAKLTYDVLSDKSASARYSRETVLSLLAPSTLDLVGFELEIAARPDRAYCLKQALDVFAEEQNAVPAEERFTYVLLDCPPSLNLLTMNAMAAAHAVLVPLQCEFFALEGLSQLLTTVEQVRNSLNPGLTHALF